MGNHPTKEQILNHPRSKMQSLLAIGRDGATSGNKAPAPDGPAPGSTVDRDLILRMQQDDLDAFEAFFDRHRSLIHRTAYGLTGDPQVAEEILQDTFLRAYRHRNSLRTEVSPVPWLHRVALNLCYSRLGRRKLRVEPIGETTQQVRDGDLGPADHAEREELRTTIRLGVAALPPKHQSVVILYYLHGMSLQETADALGIAVGTVKSRLHYALAGLRNHLAGERHGWLAEAPIPSVAGVQAVLIVALGAGARRGRP